MTTDPTTEPVTARMIFTGVMLMCINKAKRCEVGMIKCPNHDPKITIRQFDGSGAPLGTNDLPWPANHDLIFKVNKPKDRGVIRYSKSQSDFNFRKVIDLEGKDFHKSRVTANKDAFNGRRLGATAGKLYAHSLTEDNLDVVTWTDGNDPGTFVKTLGKVAQEVGLNIVCRNVQGSGIDILDSVTGEVLKSLPNLADTWYQINIDNDCSRAGDTSETQPPPPTPDIGTDFRFFYAVVSSQDGTKFDLRVSPTGLPIPSPGLCELSFLSKTKTLGLKWPTS